MIKNLKEGHEHREQAKKGNEKPSVTQEGQKLYATKFGDISKGVAKDSMDDQTLNGSHVWLAKQRQKEFWIYQILEVQAQQKYEQQMTL